MITLNKRLSVIGVHTPWPDGSALSTVGERSMVLEEYAADFWPLPPAGIAVAELEVTADVLPWPLELTLDSQAVLLMLTADALASLLTLTLGSQTGSLTLTADALVSSLDVMVDG